MRYVVLGLALLLAGCNQTAAPYGGYAPLWTVNQTPPAPVFRQPGASMTCYRYGDTLNCY